MTMPRHNGRCSEYVIDGHSRFECCKQERRLFEHWRTRGSFFWPPTAGGGCRMPRPAAARIPEALPLHTNNSLAYSANTAASCNGYT